MAEARLIPLQSFKPSPGPARRESVLLAPVAPIAEPSTLAHATKYLALNDYKPERKK